jgi:predicted dienelactone hydrolase
MHMRTATTFCLLLGCAILAQGAEYDPLALPKTQPTWHDVSVHDEIRNREIPLRVYLPAEKTPAAVVLFSHGLGGNREGNAYLGNHWAARGYVVVFVQHIGSDDSVWKEKGLGERMAALKAAAGLDNFLLRAADIPAVLNQLEAWNQSEAHLLHARLDMKQVGMAGHSFGAVTTQAVSGQSFPLGKKFTEGRVKAAVMMSPSPPRIGDGNKAFGSVKIPWLLLTGSKDASPINDLEPASRLKVFPALPAEGKYELVLENAEHSAFGDRALPGETEKRNPNHHRAILALTTAFWDAYLREQPAAKQWLQGDQVRDVLESGDKWQQK